MALISSRTANWRLFGGGGMILGGLLWVLHVILLRYGVLALGPWLYVLSLVVLAVALALVAFGETGSNGAVGRYAIGKASLVVYGAGFLLVALNAVAALGWWFTAAAGVLVVLGGLASAYTVHRKAVAKGAARWFLFLPAVVGIAWVVGFFRFRSFDDLWWVPLVLASLILITGVLYLFNSRKIG